VREFLESDIENEVEEYRLMATKFEESVEIRNFTSLLPQEEAILSTTCTQLTFKLNRQWGNQTLKSFHRL